MHLNNFGSIITFATELEGKDEAFYASVKANPACVGQHDLFEQFRSDCQKNQKTLQRVRRENVTEMILEGITGFDSAAYALEPGDVDQMNAEEVKTVAKQLEKRAEEFYRDAAEKINALQEVARALKLLAKKRAAHLDRLSK